MWFEVARADISDAEVYTIRLTGRLRPGVLGWIQRLPDGWTYYGYRDEGPPRRTPREAVDDLVERDFLEQRTESWPTLA